MKRILLLTLIAVAAAWPAMSATVSGIQIADSVALGGQTLVLNGAGKRTRFFFNVYVAGLYLPSKTADARQVLSMNGPKRMSMTLMRHLSAAELSDALREGIGRNSTPAELSGIQSQLDTLIATMTAIGGANSGDLLTIDFLADGATQVGLNGLARGKPIPGGDFQRALLNVWLGQNPVQDSLKTALLGG